MRKVRLTALLVAAVFIAVCGVFAVTQQTNASKGSWVQGRYSTAQLNNKLENGLNTAINWDSACKAAANYAQNHADGNMMPELRNNYIDVSHPGFNAASYRISTWLSLAGQPSNSDTITLKYGTASVSLQINNLNFLCGTLVTPSYGGVCDGVKTSAMYNDVKRWVNSAHPDSAPNEIGNSCLEPARTGTYTYVNDIQVVKSSGDLPGSVSMAKKHPVFSVKRDNKSRYWFADPVALKYIFAGGGITESGNIELLMHVKQIAEYNGGGTYRCTDDNGNTIGVNGPNDFGPCGVRDNDISMKLHVQVDQAWDVKPDISVSQTSRKPGQTYTVTGTAKNAGDTASKNTNWQINQIVYGPNQTPPSSAPADSNTKPCPAYKAKGNYQSCVIFNNHQGQRNFAADKSVQLAKETGVDVSQPAGSTACYFTSVNTPTPAKSPAWRYSDLACVKIVFSFGLTPNVSIDQSTVSSATRPYHVTSSVEKDAGSKSYPTKWYTVRLVYAPGVTPSTKWGDSPDDPCTYFGNPKCSYFMRNESQVFTKDITSTPPQPDTAGPDFSLGLGTSICYASSVSKPTADDTPVWRHSKLDCVVIAKSPKVQIWGGDLKVYGDPDSCKDQSYCGDVTGSISGTSDNTIYGSWGEYGVFANGTVSNFASGSGLSGGSSDPNYQQLTFANTSGKYGTYGMELPTPVGTQFQANPASGPAFNSDLGRLPSGTYRIGSQPISGGDIKGKSIIIISSGTVTINGDIRYKNPTGGDTFTDISQIPQVIIIAKKIDISKQVNWIDAWLLATNGGSGSINTCSDGPPLAKPLTSNDCNSPLTVNGPVETDHLYLRRTAGSDDDSTQDNPAETFNLRADAYLWAYGQADGTGQAETVYTTELPPRF